MSGAGGPGHRSGAWLVNTIVAVIAGLIAAISVVGLSVLVDRQSAPVIDIVDQQVVAPRVYITGAVATPGVYALAANGRLADAIAAAGGLSEKADRSGLNLAARVGDGERIVIPLIADSDVITSLGTPVGDDRININTAPVTELELLPGIGPVLAGRIVDDREANGPFLSVDGLARVDGISVSTIDELRPLVTVDG